MKTSSFENVSKSQTIKSYTELTPNMLHLGDLWDLGIGSTRCFNIFWSARNGTFEQLLRFKKINNIWFHATKIKKMKKFYWRKYNQDFPKMSLNGKNIIFSNFLNHRNTLIHRVF